MLITIFVLLGILFLVLGFFLSFRKDSLDEVFRCSKENRKLFLLCFIFFLILLNVSLLLFQNSKYPYVRPNSYFLVLSLTVIPLVGQIFVVPNKKLYHLIILGEIGVISFSFIFTLNSLYPEVLGIDPLRHRAFFDEIISLGYINQEGGLETKYKLQPVFHLNIALFSLISDTSYKISSLLSVGLGSFILIIFGIYITIKEIFYPKLALMTALIVGISNTIVRRVGIGIIPNSLGVAIGILVLALLIKKKKNEVIIGIIFLLALIINLTHSFSYMLLIFQTSIIALAAFIYRQKTFWNYLRIVLGISSLGLIYWFWVSRTYGHALIRHFRFIIEGFESEYVAAEGTGIGVFTTTMIFGRLGIILFFSISILGLIWIFVSERKFKQYSMLGIGGVSYGLSVFAMFGGGLVGISSRFWFYTMIVCGITVIFGILLFLSIIKNLTLKKVGVIIIVFGMTFAMISSPHVNFDNPYIEFHGSQRIGLKESEYSGAEFIIENISEDERIYIDFYYDEIIQSLQVYKGDYPHNRTLIRLNSPRANQNDFLNSSGYVILRNEMYERGVSWREGFQEINEEDTEELEYSRNKIYESNEVSVYTRPHSS